MKISGDLRRLLLSVAKPGRYTGGEFGASQKASFNGTQKEGDAVLKVVVSYPDLYEIGMSNAAVKVLYNLLNSLENISCERVFAPDFDFEAALRERKLPLYSLESFSPLKTFDIMGFSLGYELTLTNMLNIMDLGEIPYKRTQRGPDDPIVIAGGPAVTNPFPLGEFLDFVYIGEGEGFLLDLFPLLGEMKKAGASREDLMEKLAAHPAVWDPRQPDKIVRKGVWSGFSTSPGYTPFPVPGIKVTQDHGSVEIMRGCPNGCRFCHAGILYRPFRMRPAAIIDAEVEKLVQGCGYREISLSSLSSGDYGGLDGMVSYLNSKYKGAGVSFSLPSLRINSLSLDILEKISAVRKSGLTFAVETPEDKWQLGINKEVNRDKIIALLQTAEKRGWRVAKFYFMLGLPVYEGDETEKIIDFLKAIKRETKMNLNINLSTFVPKSHTPFQWAPQITEAESLSRIRNIKNELKGRGFKIGYHSPFVSVLEGLIARGDQRVSTMIEQAFLRGARLDSWDEHCNWNLWRELMTEEMVQEINGAKNPNEPLLWDNIDIGVDKEYLLSEYKKSLVPELSAPCSEECPSFCGACGKEAQVTESTGVEELPPPSGKLFSREGTPLKVLFSFAKTGRAAFYSHLNTMAIFERSLVRAGYGAIFTQGFNPKPVMEFAEPLSLGMESLQESATLEILNFDSPEEFIRRMNDALPEGFVMGRVKGLKPYVTGDKKISLASVFWGSDYLISYPEEPGRMGDLFQKILEKDKSLLNEALVQYELAGEQLRIRWKLVNKKGCRILNFLEEMTGENPLNAGYMVVREQLLAALPGREPLSYFDLLV